MNYIGFPPDFISPISKPDNQSPFDQIYKRVNHHKKQPFPPNFFQERTNINYHTHNIEEVPYNEINNKNKIYEPPSYYHERVPEYPEAYIPPQMPNFYHNFNERMAYGEIIPINYQNYHNENNYYEHNYFAPNEPNLYERHIPIINNHFSPDNQNKKFGMEDYYKFEINKFTNTEGNIPS
jgi:hypothetical protein